MAEKSTKEIEIKKPINLIKQVKTPNGKLNCYVVDKLDELQRINDTQVEIIGCRAYCIENGKFYIMNSEGLWKEVKPYYNEKIIDKVTRRGTYNWTFDPKIYDGIETLEVEFEPTLQDIEEDINEGGDYVYKADEKNYDGLGTVTLHVTASGNGDKVAVDENDKEPDYLSNKLVSSEGSGIILSVTDEEKLKIRYSMKDFETEFLETIPFASMQESMNPLYGYSSANLIASSIIPEYSFSFIEGQSKFICYSDTGEMKNCRLVVLKLDSNNSATIIAYSEVFQSSDRVNSKFEVACEWAGEKIKGGDRYYFGIIGTMVDTAWFKMFGYQSQASQNITMTPAFNICSNYDFVNEESLKNLNIPSSQLEANSANTIYVGVIH